MDPTSSNCSNGIVTSNDLAAFDAMGWNLNLDVLTDRGYAFDTAQAFRLPGLAALAGVPEPQTWAMMLIGFGVIGGVQRARRRAPALA
ncbi:PEPxxWA-CTERM sorting domain-containing protein [Sphingomonas sp. XMGL2]|uniref:PEPxxWA-CTERM sorting domain-containing protein n=2 Tax=Sphingomonas quercus TaxID=2842451 RepID=A0ABS6BK55_9SPHN|nr:PEPxxWA-CTERM sorting domain-containing protein [Sphingomonas quercus]